MGIEFELKYRATEKAQQAILEAFAGEWKEISMETTYYDTPQGDLSALRYTLRHRFENGVSVCTVKTPAEGAGRGEWEVNCHSIEAAIEKLCKLGGPEELMTLAQKGVIAVCGARFTRRALAVEIPGGVAELALDKGILFAEDREMPICEVEVELKEGPAAAVTQFAKALAEKYSLEPEARSKFQRAKSLRG